MTDRIILKAKLRNSIDATTDGGAVHEIDSWILEPHNLVTAFDAVSLNSEARRCLKANLDVVDLWLDIGGTKLRGYGFSLFAIPRATMISIATGMCLAAQHGRLEQFLGLDEDWEDDEQDIDLDAAA